MVTTAAPITRPSARVEADQAAAVTLDALMTRLRRAAERGGPSSLPKRIGNGTDAGESADAGELLQLQAEFNQAVVAAVSAIAQHLKQTSAEATRRPADSTPQLVAFTAQVNELAQRLDGALAALNQANESHRMLIDALGNGLQSLSQSMAEARQHTAAELAQLQPSVAGSQAALQQVQQESAATRRCMEERMEQIDLRLLRAERAVRKKIPSSSTPAADSFPVALNQTFAFPVNGRTTDGAVPSPATNDEADIPFDYFLFEQRFRGPIEEIRRRQQAYLDYFLAAESVLDLGCGRGEFVELLAQRDVPVIGVDSNEDMIAFCKSRGLPVLHGDLFEQLAVQEDGSLGGIFISQVVEHLPSDQVWKLIRRCAAKLKDHGVLLLETINPHCPDGMGWFYLDPTHVRPYPPQLLAFLCQQAGFCLDCVQFSAPLPSDARSTLLKTSASELPPEASQYQDYAVIARRSPAPLSV
jgi:2-polyprenyl-3-methyl-5-hydroxy-6-metoxy-1,4-benzoquinol methylase